MIKDPLSNVTAPLFYVPKEFIADVANVSSGKSVRMLLEKHFPEAFTPDVSLPSYYKPLMDKIYNQAFPKQKSNMKQFNLEKALSGEPVVCRNGVPAKISGYNPDAHKDDVIVGWVLNVVATATHWGIDGCHESGCEDTIDLFMAPVKKKGWINIYPRNKFPDRQLGETIHETEESALSVRLIECGQTIKIEWEE